MLRYFIKRILCKHNYVFYKQHFINGGFSKAVYYKCKNCGKIKCKVF